jgi:hypothetical protein
MPRWLGLEKARGVLEHKNADRRRGPDGRGMRPVEKHRHFAKNGARLADDCNLGIASEHLDAALGQDIELSGGFSLGQENCSGGKFLPRGVDADIED